MPIYSDDETEVEERLASLLAGAGATTSLAASAAATLRANPEKELSPRLRAALASVVRIVERAAALDPPDRGEEGRRDTQRPEELVVRNFASLSASGESDYPDTTMSDLLSDLKALLDAPSPEAASRAERFLQTLSQAENTQAQTLTRGSFELGLLRKSPQSL